MPQGLKYNIEKACVANVYEANAVDHFVYTCAFQHQWGLSINF
jgi:hypothetical protein